MKTNIKDFATFIAAIVWADGEYDAAEKVCVESIADVLDFDVSTLNSMIETISQDFQTKNEEEVNETLLNASAEIDENEAVIVYEAVLELALVDGVLTEEEVSNIIAIADVLGIDTEMAVLRLVNFVKETPELEVLMPEGVE